MRWTAPTTNGAVETSIVPRLRNPALQRKGSFVKTFDILRKSGLSEGGKGTQNCEADLSEVEKTRMKRKSILNKTKMVHIRGSRFKMLVENLTDEKIKKGNEYKVEGWYITY